MTKALEIQKRVREIAEKVVGPYHRCDGLFHHRTTPLLFTPPKAITRMRRETQKLFEESFEKVISIGSDHRFGTAENCLRRRSFRRETSRVVSLHLKARRKNQQMAVNLAALAVIRRKGRILDAVAAKILSRLYVKRADSGDRELSERSELNNPQNSEN